MEDQEEEKGEQRVAETQLLLVLVVLHLKMDLIGKNTVESKLRVASSHEDTKNAPIQIVWLKRK